jgi:hypothetical protein
MSNWQSPSNWQTPPGSGPQPYASPLAPQPYAPRPSGSNLWLWILLGVGGVVGLACCGGVAGMVWFGMNIVAQEVADQVRDNEKFREHIGELKEISADFTATAAKDESDTFVYRVKGDKGSGVLTVKQTTDDDGKEVIEEATLRLPDGKQVQIVP